MSRLYSFFFQWHGMVRMGSGNGRGYVPVYQTQSFNHFMKNIIQWSAASSSSSHHHHFKPSEDISGTNSNFPSDNACWAPNGSKYRYCKYLARYLHDLTSHIFFYSCVRPSITGSEVGSRKFDFIDYEACDVLNPSFKLYYYIFLLHPDWVLIYNPWWRDVVGIKLEPGAYMSYCDRTYSTLVISSSGTHCSKDNDDDDDDDDYHLFNTIFH